MNTQFTDNFTNDVIFATQLIHESGHLDHFVIGYTNDSKKLLVALFCENDEQKDIAVMALKILFLANGVYQYTHLSEAWMVVGINNEDIHNIKCSERDDRIETIIVNSFSKTENASHIYKLIRDNDNKFSKLDLFNETNEKIEGRFSDLISLEQVPISIQSAAADLLEKSGVPSFMEVYIMDVKENNKTVN